MDEAIGRAAAGFYPIHNALGIDLYMPSRRALPQAPPRRRHGTGLKSTATSQRGDDTRKYEFTMMEVLSGVSTGGDDGLRNR